MSAYYCPKCGALLSGDFLATAGEQFDCPECDERIRLAAVAPELSRKDAEQPLREDFVEEDPPGDRLQCRVAGNQLLLYITPGSSKENRSLGCFGVVWTGFTTVVCGGILLGGGMRFDFGLIFVALFFALFYAIGLGMLYFWLRGRFGKRVVLVEPDRLVSKFELLGRERYKEYVLNPQSRARLIESYKSNGRPIYTIAVSTSGKDARFGTFLDREEKKWLVDRINRHLRSE